jgi:hypothetical protein
VPKDRLHQMNYARRHEIKHDSSPDVGSKKRSDLRNFLSQSPRSASNQGELLCVLPHADVCSV